MHTRRQQQGCVLSLQSVTEGRGEQRRVRRGGCSGKRDATSARRHEECRHHAQLPPLASAESADICSSAGQKSAGLSAPRWRELWQDYAAFLTALERIRCLCSADLCFGTGLLASLGSESICCLQGSLKCSKTSIRPQPLSQESRACHRARSALWSLFVSNGYRALGKWLMRAWTWM